MRYYHIRNSFIAIATFLIAHSAQAQFEYLNPLPGSKYRNPQTDIIIRHGGPLLLSSIIQPGTFKITGSISGEHQFSVKLTEGDKTILIDPSENFEYGEEVLVEIGDGIISAPGTSLSGTSFTFAIRKFRNAEEEARIQQHLKQIFTDELAAASQSRSRNEELIRNPEPLDGMAGFSILTNTMNAYPAQIFGHDFNLFNSADSHYWIIENNGDSVYGTFDTVTFNNFELHPNGYMAAYHRDDSSFTKIDSSYNQVLQYQMGNGYKADVHEFKIYEDNKRFMMAYDPQIVDMTVYNPSYNPAATVIGLILQEIDSNDNVIFEWSSWDHIDILDANHIAFQNAIIDYVHCNGVERDYDGNILISSRHLSEVTKINRTTGAIMWRMGGNKNEFSFPNDPQKFNWQHDARRLDNGNILLFDNGNFHTPIRSFVKEYKVNEVNKTAELVWSFAREFNGTYMFSSAMGSAQRLPNGNTFIGWGLVYGSGFPAMTEVDSMGNVVWELKFNANSSTCYRARKHLWQPCNNLLDSAGFVADSITSISAWLKWGSSSKISSYILEYKKCDDSVWYVKEISQSSFLLDGLSSNTCYEWRIKTICSAYGDTVVYPAQAFNTDFAVGNTLGFDSLHNVVIFPNPSEGTFNIYFTAVKSYVAHAVVVNSEGREMMSFTFITLPGKNVLPIELEALPKGFYIIEITASNLKIRQKLIYH